jgi:glycosyltransferase involved in cell wall biosynthesis
MARVTVGLPVYNGERYLSQSIDAILAQTFEDLDLIISDNGSTDNTEEICREYATEDKRIRFIRSSENRGAVWNFNRVFEVSTSQYFRWATADDFSAPSQIEKCVDTLDREQDAILCYPKTVIIDADGNRVRNYDDGLDLRFASPIDRLRHLLDKVGLCNAQYGLIRSDALRKTRLFRDYYGSDAALLAELALHGQFLEIPEYLFFRRFHNEASSSLALRGEMQAFYPKAKGRRDFHVWRDCAAHFSSILRAPLTVRDKTTLSYMIFRMGISMRRELFCELVEGVGLRRGKAE